MQNCEKKPYAKLVEKHEKNAGLRYATQAGWGRGPNEGGGARHQEAAAE